MPQPRPWLDEIIDALRDLGGEGSLNAIYEQISKRNIMTLDSANWQAAIRRTLEAHSSDTRTFRTIQQSPENDLFLAPKGLNSGYWAIRESYRAKHGLEDMRAMRYWIEKTDVK